MDKKRNWLDYCRGSNAAYAERDFAKIASHGIIRNGDSELNFIAFLAKYFLNSSIFKNVDNNSTALDVACGSGYFTDQIRQFGFKTTGIDISKEGIDLAMEQFPNNSFLVADASTPLNYFKDKTFDLISIRECPIFKVITDFSLQKKIFLEYFELLKPQGIMFLGVSRIDKSITSYQFENGFEINKFKEILKQQQIPYIGPIMHFPFKHLHYYPQNKLMLHLISSFSKQISKLIDKYWIEFFIVKKP